MKCLTAYGGRGREGGRDEEGGREGGMKREREAAVAAVLAEE